MSRGKRRKRCEKVVTTSAAVLFFSFVLEIAAQGQAPKPGPEQKKLEALLGSWTFEWDTKPSIFGPGGKVTGIERYQWMPGGFFLQMNREAKTPAGDLRTLIVFGYDPISKKHTGALFDISGALTLAKITINGNTWNWAGTGYSGDGKPFQERCTMTISPNRASTTLMCELSSRDP